MSADNEFLIQLDEQLKYFTAVVQYLDRSGNLNLICAQAAKFQKEKHGLVYTFKLLIDPTDIIEENAAVGNLLLCQPVQASKIFQEVIYKIILVLELLPGEVSLSQVAVILRFSSLPVLSQMNIIQSAACLSRVYEAGVFCKMVGMVTGTSAVSTYTQSTRYYCPDKLCEGYKGNHFIRVHVPGASEAQTIRKDFTCNFCQSRLIEEKSKRTLSDKIVVEVIPEKVLADMNSSMFVKSRGQVVPVYIRDDLTKVVEIGEVFEIIGTVRKDITDDNITMMIEVNNIQKVIIKITVPTLLQKVTRNVLKLYKDRRSSPWSFVLTLGYLFGSEVVPAGSYFSLKLLLLLSLMSNKNKKVNPLHILAIGEDTEPISRLLQFGCKFKDYNSVLTVTQGVCGRVKQDKYKSAHYFIEGGALHISQNGICFVGDVGRLKNLTVGELQHALSSGKIVTTVGSRYTEGLPQQIEENLSSHVWGYVDTSCSCKTSKLEDVFFACDTGNISKSLLDSFSILCFVDSGDFSTSLEMQEKMCEEIIQSAFHKETSDIPITTEEFQKFLRFAERLEPEFTKEAETIIQSYFLTCRKSRMSDVTSVPLSIHHTLMSLAYSHAKLSLRSMVTLDDALMAIRLCEESLTARFGLSILSVQPLPHISSGIVSSILGPENDQMMLQFHRNLLKYCSLASGLEE